MLELDLRSPGLLRRFTACAEEVNQVALSLRGDTLAAASDAGEVTLFSLHSGKALRTLRRGHANIVAALAFRPNRTAELLSAGLDARVVAWDTSNGRVRRAWDMNEVMASVEAREHPGIGGNPNRLQVVNPPMAHSVAVGQMDAANAARYAAVACGDGSVALLLLDDAPAGKKGPASCWSLGREAGGHTSCAAHVSFPAFSRGQPLVLSAGNDGRALLWDWGAYVAGNTAQPTVVAQAKHGAKLNWVATATEPSPARVYLADVSPTLAVYELRTG